MPSLPANDLRSEAREYQRDRNHNAKWARGAGPAAGKRCPHVLSLPEVACDDCATRPLHRDYDRRCGRRYNELKHNWQRKESAQKTTLARKALRKEVVDGTDGPLAGVSDSSGEEEVHDASTAPVPDFDVMYSFDAQRGPGRGSDILTQAINQAVQRYENKETEKIVKEYDLVEDAAEGYAGDEDDDFDFIDEADLK